MRHLWTLDSKAIQVPFIPLYTVYKKSNLCNWHNIRIHYLGCCVSFVNINAECKQKANPQVNNKKGAIKNKSVKCSNMKMCHIFKSTLKHLQLKVQRVETDYPGSLAQRFILKEPHLFYATGVMRKKDMHICEECLIHIKCLIALTAIFFSWNCAGRLCTNDLYLILPFSYQIAKQWLNYSCIININGTKITFFPVQQLL